jgi:ribosomal-protein-alanine N-acetyltransferase
VTTAVEVRLQPATRAWLEALVEGDEVAAARVGVEIVPGWAGFPEVLPGTLAAVQAHGPDPWAAYLFFESDGALVGFGGFKGQPADGAVEIGYAIAPARQGRGLATAATRVMIDRARAANVRRVVAHTLAETNPSCAVLTRCGFQRTATIPGAGPDEQDVWRWERDLLSG